MAGKDTMLGAQGVLVVDDEPMLLTTASAMLKKLGCTVLSVPDGKRALRHLKEDPQAQEGLSGFLPKPYSLDELRAALQQAVA